MKRFAMFLAVALACGTGVARAQTSATTSQGRVSGDERVYLEATGGATFGHKAGGSFGAEGGYFWTDALGVFGEVGEMTNVTTSDVEAHAGALAPLGITADVKVKATYFDAGLIYRVQTGGRTLPYVSVGFGAARVDNGSIKFSRNGSDVTGSLPDLGVQLGGDLSGTYTKAFIAVGVGVRFGIGPRLIGDASYRYGRVGKNSASELDPINTNRLQFGVGVRF